MVATLAQMASAEYYLESQKSYRHPNEYYLAGKEPDGEWFNPAGLFSLTDSGKIDSKHFFRLYSGFGPESREALTRNAGSEKRAPGVDMTFSADKSISALWALLPVDKRAEIERIVVDAARAALEATVFKYCAYTRLEEDGQTVIVPADIMAATFLHRTSRENDPQLHVHCTFFNVARTHKDGKFRAHHQYPVYSWKKPAGAAFRNYLAWELQQKFGVAMEQYGPDGQFTRIAGMPQDLLDMWSKRRRMIVAKARELGISIVGNAARMAGINTLTRSAKSQDNTTEADCERFATEAATMGDVARLIAAVTGKTIKITAAKIRELTEKLERLPKLLVRQEAIFQLGHIQTAVWNTTSGIQSLSASETSIERVLKLDDIVVLDRRKPSPEAKAGMAHTQIYTTRPTIEMEQSVQDMAAQLGAATGRALPGKAIRAKLEKLREEGYPLSGEQSLAIRYVTKSDGQIAIIEGAAGSGKTTTLRPIADLYREQGRTIIPTAVPWRVALALGDDLKARAFCVQKLLSMAEKNQLKIDRKTVIIVDEAGLLSTHQAHQILELAQHHGAKLIFAGDTEQQQPVEAGPGLRLVRDKTGSKRIDKIRRQKADLEDVLVHVHGQTPETARFQAGLTSPAERERILAAYEAVANKPTFTPWQIAASEAFRDGKAAEAIAAYHARGRFHLCHHEAATVDLLVEDWTHYGAANPDKSTVVLARTHDEVKALSCAIRERHLADYQQNTATRASRAARRKHGTEGVIIQVSARAHDPAHTEALHIAIGEKLRIGATHRGHDLHNGSVVTVEDYRVHRRALFSKETRVLIHARTTDGRRVSFHHDEIRDMNQNVRLSHGYALTFASAQGLTVDRAFLLANENPARETIYAAATRHREALDIYVNRKPIALDIAERRPDDRTDAPVTDAAIRKHLAKLWSRSSPKDAAIDFMSPELEEEIRETARPGGKSRRTETQDNANDNAIVRLYQKARHQTFDWQHDGDVARFAVSRTQVLETYHGFRHRIRAGEHAVALEPAYVETMARHRTLLKETTLYREGAAAYGRLLNKYGGITKGDLNEFEALYGRAKSYRRSVLAKDNKARKTRRHERQRAGVQPASPLTEPRRTEARQLELGLAPSAQARRRTERATLEAPAATTPAAPVAERKSATSVDRPAARKPAAPVTDKRRAATVEQPTARKPVAPAEKKTAAPVQPPAVKNPAAPMPETKRTGAEQQEPPSPRAVPNPTELLYQRFMKEWNNHIEQAARADKHSRHIYAEGYGKLIERMTNLAAKPGLPADAQGTLAAMLKEHKQILAARPALAQKLHEERIRPQLDRIREERNKIEAALKRPGTGDEHRELRRQSRALEKQYMRVKKAHRSEGHRRDRGRSTGL